MRALARDQLDRSDGVDHDAPWGAALDTDGVWTMLLDVSPDRSFGHALILAARHDASSIDLLVDREDAASVARRAQLFLPEPTVWAIDDTSLTRAVAAERPVTTPPVLEPSIAAALDVPDVVITVEHGVVTGECRGVEIARVTGLGDEQRVDVGVGAYDQGAFAVMNADLSPDESLQSVLAQVLEHRTRGAEPHPINRLVRERWLRSELVEDPTPVGVDSLVPIPGVTLREGLYEIAPAFALSEGDERVVVACSVGIDLDLVPAAAEVAARENADRIVLVLPERDQHAVTKSLADRCRLPITFVTADVPWS